MAKIAPRIVELVAIQTTQTRLASHNASAAVVCTGCHTTMPSPYTRPNWAAATPAEPATAVTVALPQPRTAMRGSVRPADFPGAPAADRRRSAGYRARAP